LQGGRPAHLEFIRILCAHHARDCSTGDVRRNPFASKFCNQGARAARFQAKTVAHPRFGKCDVVYKTEALHLCDCVVDCVIGKTLPPQPVRELTARPRPHAQKRQRGLLRFPSAVGLLEPP
jgi:hypothetical protein